MNAARYLLVLSLCLSHAAAAHAQSEPPPSPPTPVHEPAVSVPTLGDVSRIGEPPGADAPLPTPDAALASDRDADAAAHFARAVELYQEGAYQPALIEFQQAHATSPDYRLLYNIAQTHRKLQDYLGAIRSYEGYLAQGGAEIADERRQQVEAHLASLRTRVGQVSISVNVPGVEIYVDETKVGVSPLSSPVPANVGRHRVVARAADGSSDSALVEVAGGERSQVTLQLAPRPVPRAPAPVAAVAPVPAPPRVPVAPPSTHAWSTARKGAIVTWAAGGAALVAGGIAGIRTKRSNDELDDLLAVEGVDRSALADQRDSVRRLSLATDVLLVTGAAALVTGTVLWLLDPGGERNVKAASATSRLRLEVGPASLGMRGRF